MRCTTALLISLFAGSCLTTERQGAPRVADQKPQGDDRVQEAPPDPEAALRYLDEGRSLREDGQHAAAFEAFERARIADPSLGLAHLEGAICAQYIGIDDERIRRRFEQATVLLADNPRAHFERAAFEESHGNTALAVEGYRRALDLRPSLLAARIALGRALLTLDDNEGARETFRQVLEAEPKNVAALLGHADACERMGDNGATERALKAVIAAYPEVSTHRQRLIAFYERTGQAKKAEAEKRRLEKADPVERRRLRSLKPSRKRRR